jgi:hypothetical protein
LKTFRLFHFPQIIVFTPKYNKDPFHMNTQLPPSTSLRLQADVFAKLLPARLALFVFFVFTCPAIREDYGQR